MSEIVVPLIFTFRDPIYSKEFHRYKVSIIRPISQRKTIMTILAKKYIPGGKEFKKIHTHWKKNK